MSEVAEQVLALARRARFSLDESIPSNEERAQAGQVSRLARMRASSRKTGWPRSRKSCSASSRDRDEAQSALTAAREAMALRVARAAHDSAHACRVRQRVKKIFEQFVPRYSGRHGGYTRITKLGTRRAMARISSGSTWSSFASECLV